ncbi:MAG TPA: hypothetical protein VK106_06260, partial [Balneolaceae bacterium]|nr:hypothetical protein [Balneolaceae bacterium]
MSEEKNLFEEFSPVSTEEWEKVIEQDLKGADYKKKLKWETGEGIEVLPFYRRADRTNEDNPVLSADHQWSIGQKIYSQDITAANESAQKAID